MTKNISLLTIFVLYFFSKQITAQTSIRISESPAGYGIEISDANELVMKSPPEGLWCIGTEWSDSWPSSLTYSQGDSVEQFNSYSIIHGSLDLKEGTMVFRDAYRMEGERISCTRRWHWTGSDTLKKTTLMVKYETPGFSKGVVMPGILYHGNPAGERSGRTPYYNGETNEIAIFEEHRFPMPFVSREWLQAEKTIMVALHSQPSPVPFGHRPDQWWSLGVINGNKNTDLVLLSGPCGFNGKKSVIKSFQGWGEEMMEDYDNAWLDLPPGTIIEKTFYLETGRSDKPGSGFQQAVETSLDLFTPWDMASLPEFDEIIRSKINFSLSRYKQTGDVAGFWKYPDRNYYVLGWCGQSMAPGYAFQVLGKEFNIPDEQNMVQSSLDFLSTTDFYESGFYTWYNIDKSEWFMNNRPEWLSQGQAMLNMANAIRQADKNDYQAEKWLIFLEKAADFHADRILKKEWQPESTNEGFFIAPLSKAYDLIGKPAYLNAAKKAAKYYADLYLGMDQVYWGGTLDASCEDKEGAFAALQGFIELYETEKNPEYLIWAKHAGDICLTYTVVWDIPLPPGRLTDHNFKTRGWTAVSVQNMHIDVFGVLIAPFIYKLGYHLENASYMKTAKLMFRSCGQLIDPYGSQGEQPYQTNYIQNSWKDKPIHERRGNYHETWTVFWITAHFLNAAAMFMEMGVY
ncbi:MAG: hypothetical protein HN352_03840 [Bacteroidetes bacterium]|jgi:hypothetical protein|nr:hypothetical protein [Bacteroidota bacterium]MBT5427802.1 hypothetical protein [Bacteroidota bacterium]MBT7462674.1 hypothetical protein [Bacteroidota bacterium]